MWRRLHPRERGPGPGDGEPVRADDVRRPRTRVVDEVIRVSLEDEAVAVDSDHAVQDAQAERRVPIEDDVAHGRLRAGTDENQISSAEPRLHARAFHHRVTSRAAELRRSEEQPRSEEQDDREDRGRCGVGTLRIALASPGEASASPGSQVRYPTATTESSSAEVTETSGEKSHVTLVPPETEQLV
jgi:hypothetical protein